MIETGSKGIESERETVTVVISSITTVKRERSSPRSVEGFMESVSIHYSFF